MNKRDDLKKEAQTAGSRNLKGEEIGPQKGGIITGGDREPSLLEKGRDRSAGIVLPRSTKNLPATGLREVYKRRNQAEDWC